MQIALSGISAEQIPAGILASLERMRRAWDAGDADAYAREFTEDASYVIFIGTIARGRDAIRADHVPLFEKWQRGSRLSMAVLGVRMLGDDVAVVLTQGGLGKGARIRYDKTQTFVFVREGGVWRCAAFQNTKRNRLLAALSTRERKRLAAA